MSTGDYIAREKAKMKGENTFGPEFYMGRASATELELLKNMAKKHGTAYLK